MHPLSSDNQIIEVLGGPLAPLFRYFLQTCFWDRFFIIFFSFRCPRGAQGIPRRVQNPPKIHQNPSMDPQGPHEVPQGSPRLSQMLPLKLPRPHFGTFLMPFYCHFGNQGFNPACFAKSVSLFFFYTTPHTVTTNRNAEKHAE